MTLPPHNMVFPSTGSLAEHLSEASFSLLQWLYDYHLSEREVRAVALWWWQEREPAHSLIDFLMSQQVLLRSAGKCLDQLFRGEVVSDPALPLLTVYGLDHLREQLHEHQLLESDHAVNPPTMIVGSVVPIEPKTALIEIPQTTTVEEEPPEVPTPQIGMILGRCLLTEQIGKGATGVVFRALHRSLNVPVAIKVLNAAVLARDPNVARQFRSEARLLAQLNHPHVVRVWDFEDANPFPYLTLEYVEGLSLSELIQQSGRIQANRALKIALQVVEGLATAYKLGIVHRDVKPANILLSKEGNAKLADLGLAMVVDATSELSSEYRPRGVAGTVAYMAPEQAIPNSSIDHRSDIYALGGTLYHALTGRLPFPGKTRVEVLFKHAHERLEPLSSLCPDIAPSVAIVVERMMAKRAAERYESYEQLRYALLEALADLGGSSSGISPGPMPPPVPPTNIVDNPAPTITPMWRNLQARFGNANRPPTEGA